MPLGQRETNKLQGSAGSPRKTSRASRLPSCTAKAHLCTAVMLADFMGMQVLLYSLPGAEPNKFHHLYLLKGVRPQVSCHPAVPLHTIQPHGTGYTYLLRWNPISDQNTGLRKWPLSLIMHSAAGISRATSAAITGQLLGLHHCQPSLDVLTVGQCSFTATAQDWTHHRSSPCPEKRYCELPSCLAVVTHLDRDPGYWLWPGPALAVVTI